MRISLPLTAVPWLILFLLLSGSASGTYGECFYTAAMLASGSSPPPGACAGPSHRIAQLRAAQNQTSCGLSNIIFFRDGNASAGMTCGECRPGETYVEDGACDLGEFCSDDARCTAVANHPFLGAACPFEVPAHTAHGYCGPGLHCYAHECVECLPASTTAELGLRCSDGFWARASDVAASSESDHRDQMLTIIVIELALVVLITAIRAAMGSCGGSKTKQKRREK